MGGKTVSLKEPTTVAIGAAARGEAAFSATSQARAEARAAKVCTAACFSGGMSRAAVLRPLALCLPATAARVEQTSATAAQRGTSRTPHTVAAFTADCGCCDYWC